MPIEFNKYKYGLEKIKMYTPDIVVYIGNQIYPNIFIDDFIFIRADSKYKCYKIMEVIETYYYIYINGCEEIEENKIQELVNWDKEVYRKKL